MFKHSALLERYLDGECTPAQKTRAEKLLRRSPALGEEIELLRQVNTVLAGAGRFPVSPAYESGFRRKLALEPAAAAERETARPSWRRFPGWVLPLTLPRAVGAVAALLVVVIGAYLIYRSGGAFTRVAAVKGSADIFRSAEARWVRALPGEKIHEGDILSTGADGTIDLAMEGVYALRIKGETRVAARRLSRGRGSGRFTFGLKEGKVFVVTYADFAGRSLSVEGPAAEAVARGTAFLVEAQPGSTTSLLVESGEVRFHGYYNRDNAKASIVVAAGTFSSAAEGAFPEKPRPLTPGEKEALEDEIAKIGQSVWEVSTGAAGKKFKNALISLIVSPTSRRVDELLQPCGIMVSQAAPIEVYNQLLEALQATKKGDYRQAVALLRDILEKHPDSRYNSVLKLLLGAQYYAFLSEPDRAIAVFEEVARDGEPEWQSLARTAVARIHQELARRSYRKVVKDYGDSVDAERARQELKKSDELVP